MRGLMGQGAYLCKNVGRLCVLRVPYRSLVYRIDGTRAACRGRHSPHPAAGVRGALAESYISKSEHVFRQLFSCFAAPVPA